MRYQEPIRWALVLLGLVLPGFARAADGQPSDFGGPLFLVGAAIVVVLILWIVIRGALNLTNRDEQEDDPAGVGVLEDIDEDDKKKK